MTVYKLKNKPREFKVLEHDPYKRALDSDDLKLLRRLRRDPVESSGLKDVWVNEQATFTQHFSSAEAIPDISKWRTFLVLRENAYQALRDEIESDGEFLPITIDGELFTVFNVMSFGEEDKKNIKFEDIDGEQGLLAELAFIESDLLNKYVFKSKDEGCMSIYCDDKLISLCEEHNLKGLSFDTNLLDVFED
ncbi:hypothetical protein AB0533_004577 [Vibrio parahaemolyticus]|uniref:hypothetical protein n=1 Tax=Vibrio parahaemolyticus TaxID=670 RepID=UPI00084A8FEB|nr:hypothetical protein [Vibrio parahaemolyticus]EGR2229756.1 hypothetical protein [Vibrio parahaemolyticus]EGR3145946.1 hypothetical protein [Vibrio parahaemolyticus]EGR3163679.1 hypothetical protein [Vibrio parahaemolyticus]EGX7689124.1 hypothetical protein [Vibrio parahaemolyticus]EHR1011509.1 hypothetical protein [Vibrio parahaemolyticus]